MRQVPVGIADNKFSSDHYHYYKEDIHLMSELGIEIYRFSFSRSRSMTGGWSVNSQGLKFYHNFIDECIKNDIEPFPTLYHCEIP